MRDTRYDILFEPVKIGPVTAPNRFYQVPHCTGMGHRYPQAEARLRGIKAEGGWGVVSTQETEIHPTSDLTPSNQARLWDERDIPALRLVTEAIHEHGSLAAIQLVHNGLHSSNRYSRRIPIAPSHSLVDANDPVQARAMDKSDIQDFRRWHVNAAKRAKQAGFDIIYVYVGHDMTLLQHFLLARHNHRTDEYGGNFDNRLRLFREVIEDTKAAVGNTCAVAVRLAVDELLGSQGIQSDSEAHDIIESLAELPDLWDVNLSNWSNDSQTSRFSDEGFQESYTSFVKSVTTKPVVGVGRYTSPDSMVRVVRKGILDFIGAARPSIADPYLPKKIEAGQLGSIRECIGCNICVSADMSSAPLRCTQNPTISEEWRRDWHPEFIPNLKDSGLYLIIGGGPAGLEAGRALAQRGADVMIAEMENSWGGRVALESRLPGLAVWGRVAEWRLWELQKMPNVELYLQSELSSNDILEYGIPHIGIATGARWRTDCVGRSHRAPLNFLINERVAAPDKILKEGGGCIDNRGPVVIFDDDRFYLASVLAELLVGAGHEVIYVTPAPLVAAWSVNTLEQERIQKRLIDLEIQIYPLNTLEDMRDESLQIKCVYSAHTQEIPCGTLLPVTSRLPNDQLWNDLKNLQSHWQESGIKTVNHFGDCYAPGLIATAIYAGHEYARNAQMDVEKHNGNREDYGHVSTY